MSRKNLGKLAMLILSAAPSLFIPSSNEQIYRLESKKPRGIEVKFATYMDNNFPEINSQENRPKGNEDYKRVIKEIKTPEEVIGYFKEHLVYGWDTSTFKCEDYWASFKHIHKNGTDDCDGYAVAAAALLSDNGFKPLIMKLYKDHSNFRPKIITHAVYLYRDSSGKWGTLGEGEENCVTPEYSSIKELVKRLGYEDEEIIALDTLSESYIDSDENIMAPPKRSPLKSSIRISSNQFSHSQ